MEKNYSMNHMVSEFEQNYSPDCRLENYKGFTAEEIEKMILTVNPNEEDADVMAAAVVEYVTENY